MDGSWAGALERADPLSDVGVVGRAAVTAGLHRRTWSIP